MHYSPHQRSSLSAQLRYVMDVTDDPMRRMLVCSTIGTALFDRGG
jgi:hypothetical protein